MAQLKQDVSLLGIVALGAGTAIGVGIFSILAPGASLAGPGMLLSMVIAAVPMILFAVTYAFMGSAVPVSGASYEWSRRFIHPFAGFLIGWLRMLGSTAALVLYAFVLVQYWSMVIELPAKLTMFAVLTLFWLLNLRGISLVARSQALMVFVLLATCMVLVVSAVPQAEPSNFTPLLLNGWSGVLAAVPLMVSLFLGIETATEVGEEVRNGRRTIPLGIGLSVLLTAGFYLIVAGATLGVLGSETLGQSEAPLLDLASATMGRFGLPLILLTATVAIGTSLNAIFLIFSRYLFAMGRQGVLPGSLARVHARWGTPWVASTVVYGLCLLGLLLPGNLVFLFLAVNIPTLLKYGASCYAAVRVVSKHPEVYRQASFKFRPAAMQAWAWSAIVCAVIVLLLGITADWRPYTLLAAWAALGIAWFAIRSKQSATSTRTTPP